jgi:hypothetical protein
MNSPSVYSRSPFSMPQSLHGEEPRYVPSDRPSGQVQAGHVTLLVVPGRVNEVQRVWPLRVRLVAQ